MRRICLVSLLLVGLLLGVASQAFGHAIPLESTPEQFSVISASPPEVSVTFNEGVQLVRGEDFTVVDQQGQPVSAGPGRVTDDRRVIAVPLQPDLDDGTYTVTYKVIGADSHVIPGIFTFGVNVAELAPPYRSGAGGGPAENSPWGVGARFLELLTLGGLLGLIAFRVLVWAGAWRRAGTPSERDRLLVWWRDTHWMLFGVLALGAMIAQGYSLVVQSARVLGVDVWTALGDATGVTEVLGRTDFGTGVQIRAALLFVLFALGAVQFMREYGGARNPRPATAAGSLAMSATMALLVLAVMTSVSYGGHARVSEPLWLQISGHLVHMAATAIWVTGLALVVAVNLRAPRVVEEPGRTIAAGTLIAFSRVALWTVVAVGLTGVVRTFGELDAPAELWQTAYGRSIVLKLILLAPLGALALYNRRIVAALDRTAVPSRATLRLVRRTVGGELALALAIVLVATVLVAQVPGA